MGKRTKPRAKVHEGIEIRYNDDGTVDEIIVMSLDRKVCLLHLEQMSDEYYWVGLAPPKGDNDFPVHVDLCSEKPITARVRMC